MTRLGRCRGLSVAKIADMCPACGGTGWHVIEDDVLHPGSGFDVPCAKCEGTGFEPGPVMYTRVGPDGEVERDG
jgi:DnaJ-class molecular chaperone